MAGKNVKRYKCPYCEKRVERNQLQYHIGKDHQDMIPQGYTAARVAFNYLNKKTEGHCIICGGVTAWNEDKKRYERLCDKPACKKKYVKMTEDRLKKARGVTKKEMMSDPQHQDMMLKNRSISGIYKFEDGGKVPYVGSYEKNFLEFMDQYLHVSSMDIQAPGPTIKYYFEGKKHFWITDFYYTPYNLVFDIKDGGSNPNKRQMDEYRAKQRNKEAAIIDQGEYNYLRLTDNKFDQLIEIMIDLKDSMTELDGPYYQKVSGYKPVVKINESAIEEGTLNRTFGLPYKINKQMKKDGIKTGYAELIKNHGNPSVDKVIMKEKDISDISYVRRDNNSAITQIRTIGDRIDKCKQLGDCKETHGYYENIKKNYIDKGLTKKDCDLTIASLKKSNAMYTERIKQLRVEQNRSTNEAFCVQGKYILLAEAKSTLDRNFKKKEIDAEFKYINISNMGKYKPQVEKHYGKFFDYTVKHSTGEIVVDVKKDKVAGYVFVNNTDQKGFIMPLVVVKEYRGCGLGSKLFEDAITKYGGTDLCVDKDNEIAIKLYKDHGFEIAGDGDTKNRYYMIKHGVKITNEVFCQNDPEMVTYKVLTDPITYKNRDITKLAEYVQSLSESTREYNKSFFDTALAQTEAFYHEYSNFIKSGKCSYDVQSICESFSLKEVTLSEIQAIYTELKTLFSECTTPIVEEQLNSFDLDYLKEYVL
jgi:ribosomal protein S18 acetylase RimI-like enzyme